MKDEAQAPPPVSVEAIVVHDQAGVVWVQVRALTMAAAAGLERADQWKVAIAASEAATNMVKHAGEGTLTLRRYAEPEAVIEFEARDEGPGFADPDRAFTDGVSEGIELVNAPRSHLRRGLGCGLGAIRRLMDRVELQTAAGRGTTLVARKARGPG